MVQRFIYPQPRVTSNEAQDWLHCCMNSIGVGCVIGRDLKAFASFAANDKEDSESFAGTLLRSLDQGTKTCIRTERLLCMYF